MIPQAPKEYSPEYERRRNELLERELHRCYKRLQDMELGGGQRLILRSPDGTRWSITVDNTGTIAASSI